MAELEKGGGSFPSSAPSPGKKFEFEDRDGDATGGGGSPDEVPPDSLTDYVDWAMNIAGGSGPYNKRLSFYLCTPWILCGMQTLAQIFTALPMHRRRVCTNQLVEGSCEDHPYFDDDDCTVTNHEYSWEHPSHSVVSDFDLVCEAKMFVPLLSTLYFFGFLLGVLLIGSLADTRGRRRAYLWSIGLTQIGGLLAACAPNYMAYAVGRTITGVGIGGLGLTVYVLNAEVVGANFRPMLMFFSNACFALGVLLLAPTSYTVRPWRQLSWIIWLFGVPFMVLYAKLWESPKWLASQGKADEVHAVMCHMATENKRPLPPPPSSSRNEAAGPPDTAKSDEALKELFCDSRISFRFYSMCFAWFALSLGYYGLSMNIAGMARDVYIASAVSAIVEVPAFAIALYTTEHHIIGRRGSTAGGLLFGGAACLFCAFVEEGPAVFLLAYCGKFAIALAFATVYLFAAELFPTSVRSRSMGLQSFMARIGGMLSANVAALPSRELSMTVFGLPCVIAGIMLLANPETRGKPLADTIDDLPSEAGGSDCSRCFGRYGRLEEDRPSSPSSSSNHAGGPQPTTFGAASS